ncbi:DUF4118 domain-containing protein [Duganella sp. FT92W]|uniref:histidine kinase n=1 Tax=Pseudoduganella rivuli TaxID=2666085 RepID=A0A7X2LQP1_9BURK|nr:DUF4118 domain-containing protein [Pseudoduganella rivuli]
MKKEPVGLFRSVLIALVVCSVATLVVTPFRGVLLDANLALYYLLIVVWLTVKVGSRAGFAGSVLAVLFFDVFLVPPYDSLTVHDPQHVLTFAMLLAVALVTSRLVDSLRTQTTLAETREQLSESLRAMGDALLSAQNADDVRRIGEQFVGGLFDAKAWILPPGFASADDADPRLTVGMRKIAGAMLRQRPGGAQAPVTSAGVVYFPLQARERVSGVMLLALSGKVARLSEAQERWLQTASVQLALALDRVHNIDVASKARLAEKNERFRNSILSSISHDIRTPLTTVVGLAEQLAMQGTGADTATRLHRAALRMDATVTNLLDIARFSQHGIVLNADWASIDELIGSAIQGRRGEASGLVVDSEIQGTLALVKLDALLIEKVLDNLIGNAVRHAHGATRIAVRARFRQRSLQLSVIDNGCGIAHPLAIANVLAPDGDKPRDHGGLGLSICQAICDAHGGRLRIFGRPGKGCCAIFVIPITESMPLDYAD